MQNISFLHLLLQSNFVNQPIWKKYFFHRRHLKPTVNLQSTTEHVSQKSSLLWLAGGYWFLEHATWNGLNVADLVFPWYEHFNRW